MNLVRYQLRSQPRVLVGMTDGKSVCEIGAGSIAELLSLPLAEFRQRLSFLGDSQVDISGVELLAPIDRRTEVWACGVTYQISREARIEESERSADVYARVYDAERPEIFFKSAAWRAQGTGSFIAVRADSEVNVPEPEVALVVNSSCDIVGYTICNDVSSRSIEGENPLYLPQAKVYLGSCALGPGILPAWDVADPYALGIAMSIKRDGATIWSGTASTAQLHRKFDELVSYVTRADVFPDGVIVSTGTCLVPPAPFSLEQDDVVEITVDGIGTLSSHVVRGLALATSQLGQR